MTRRLVMAACLAVMAIAASCSDDEPSIAAYCLRLDEWVRVDVSLDDVDRADPEARVEGLKAFSEAVGNAAEQAPSDVAGDLEVIDAWVAALVTAFDDVTGDPLADAVRFDEALDGLTNPTDALARVRAHSRSECGFDLNEAP